MLAALRCRTRCDGRASCKGARGWRPLSVPAPCTPPALAVIEPGMQQTNQPAYTLAGLPPCSTLPTLTAARRRAPARWTPRRARWMPPVASATGQTI